jgi:hypothetical protein
MAQYLVLRNTVYKGKAVNAGDIIDAEEKDKDIRVLVAIGKAEKAEDAPAKSVKAKKETADAPTAPENAAQ